MCLSLKHLSPCQNGYNKVGGRGEGKGGREQDSLAVKTKEPSYKDHGLKLTSRSQTDWSKFSFVVATPAAVLLVYVSTGT